MSKKIFKFFFCFTLLSPAVHLIAGQAQAGGQAAQEGTVSPRLPPGSPHVKNGFNLFIRADYLLWKAMEQNISFCSNITGVGVGVEVPKGEVFSPKFCWESGCRVGLGYNIGHDEWDTQLIWTWFEDTASRRATGSSSQRLAGTISSPAFNITSLKAHSQLILHLNLLDWQWGREFYVSKWLTLRPFGGLRTGWIHQNWKTHFKDDVRSSIGVLEAFDVFLRQRFWGIGLLGCLDTEWGLISGLSLYANGGFSLLYGYFHHTRREDASTSADPDTIVLDGIQSFRSEQGIAELQWGLRWDQMLFNDRFHFRIQAGWDHMVFFDHNRFFFFTQGGAGTLSERGGNLAFQGWSTSVRFDF